MPEINIQFREENMKAALKLKLCNRSLGFLLVVILASDIQLEATSGKYTWSVWAHIIAGILLIAVSLYHIFLHYRYTNWFSRFAKNRNTNTRVLWWIFLLTVISGIAATIMWLGGEGHTPLGGVHGKIGFLMVLAAIIHVVRHTRNRAKNC